MAARIGRAAGLLVMAVALPVVGCDDTGSGGSEKPDAAAVKAARAFQQASVEQDWKAACEARTERLRQSMGAATIAECVDITKTSRTRAYPDAQVTTGETVEVEASGQHPAGIGLRVTFEAGSAAPGMITHTALRLVPGERGAWLVDQTVNLDETMGTDTKAVRAALARK
ncbi:MULTISPECIES: hypothetical protein [unclassified Streptomyces]|uniref:hypothetical protein n=1 Tax=unclassified Streptomyces TaxID=2593676 RepID=UPI0029B1854C|nr:hypothetical protein [Streptomyces sp. FL07-04A]MDX3575608.1 hypothetical protein [Streptomyces sp. FL07-04A]